jgi:lipopolysaccharide transport system ATP-binding protein
MSVVIQVDRLSKQYRLGVIGGKRLVDDVNRWWAKLRGKEDPLSKVGQPKAESRKQKTEIKNDGGHDKFQLSTFPISDLRADTLWALRDVTFEVKQGEVLGIIGRNGAGKSTLLKILSRVTGPTSGEVRVKGRIASLLEVGTGFNPEMTGRENVFLNGAILGMTKAEIRVKFDEIVDFSGVEKFIDTPVKRYSSGMTVRLAFAVAAHLEPEILIVDEVLAVGDAAFQKKCVGKMQDVAGEGRTILFVSHNMASMQSLCGRAMLLNAGQIVSSGEVYSQIQGYHELTRNQAAARDKSANLGPNLALASLTITPDFLPCGETATFAIKLRAKQNSNIYQCILLIYSSQGSRIGIVDLRPEQPYRLSKDSTLILRGAIEKLLLVEGTYHVGLFLNADGFKGDLLDLAHLHISGQPPFRENSPVSPAYRGFVEFQSSFTSTCE